MRIAVVGAGGIGGIYGASLAAAGADVTFIARGAHLAAMQANGLRIEGDRGALHVQRVEATDDPAGVGAVDIVLFCVKLWDVETAGAAIRPMVGPGTGVIALQNGVDSVDRLIPILGQEAVMGGTAFVTGSIIAPGVIRQTGTHQVITFGELYGRMSGRGQALAELCAVAGFEAVFSPDIRMPVWSKFLMLVPLANVNALTRQPLGRYLDDPDLFELVDASLLETMAVCRAEGILLPPDIYEQALAQFRVMPPHHMTSMGNDLVRGNRLELPWFAGKVVELGRKHGIATPVNRFVCAALKPYVNGPPG